MPSSGREKVAIGLTSAVLAIGAITYLQPPSNDARERERQRTQQNIQDLGDAQENEHRRMREDGKLHGEAETSRALIPGEHRPPEPNLRLKVRIP